MKTLGSERPWRVWLWLFVIGLTAGRFYVAARTGLAPDEAYYWQWSKNLGLSYPDHPPMIAWLIRLGTIICGDTPLGVRLPGIIGAVAATFLCHRIALSVGLDEKHAAAAAILSSALIAPAGAALIMTPDTPLGVLWLAASALLIRLSRGADPRIWYGMAVVAALSILSKYSGFLLITLIGMVCIGERRRLEPTHHLIAAAGVMVALLLPHLIAEWQHGFSAGRFQGRHLMGRLPMAQALQIPARLLALLSGQIGLMTPLVAIFAIKTLWENPRRLRVLSLGLLLPILATASAAVLTHPEQNWASLGHPAAAILAVYGVSKSTRLKRPLRWLAGVVGSGIVLSVLVHVHLLYPYLPLPPKRDPTARLHGFEALRAIPMDPDADGIVCDNYGLAAQVAWQFRGQALGAPVVGADRSALASLPTGRVILLDQAGDVAGAEIPMRCERLLSSRVIPLRLKSSGVWDRVNVSVGTGCRVSPPNTVVTPPNR